MNKAWTALPTLFLDQYSQDLTQLAAQGAVPFVTVRDEEINQILQILGRTKQNSLVLVGEPGVGKNSIIEAIATRMIEDKVPEILKDKRLVLIDIASLLSSDQSPQLLMQKVIDEIITAGNVIVAIPDVQVLVGTAKGALDAASLLTQALDRGYMQIISSASYADYHRYVESDAALTSLLEVVEIKEVNPEQAMEILEEEIPSLESRHKVFYTYPALLNAVTLAQHYMPEKVLPQSAIELLDQGAQLVASNGQKWVNHTDIEKVVEQKTHTPVGEASQTEATMLLTLEKTLHERIIGQEEAVLAVANALRRSRAGLHTGKRPIASFLFVGPTGVGKTETAKAVSDVYYGSESSMIRLDMSEYQDATAISKLIGATAANSDSYTEGGNLTQPVREHPFSLILLDEIEKASLDVLNLFLQVLDDGRVTENTGRTIFFNNCIIVATSNAGSPEILQLMQQGVSPVDLPQKMLRILESHFRPEFINRFDAIIPFHALRLDEAKQITQILLTRLINTTKERGYVIQFTPEAVEAITALGFDPLYGARPLRRVVQEKVEGLLATKILDKTLHTGEPFVITGEMIH